MKLPGWIDSIRAWALVIVLSGMTAGFFMRIFPVDKYAEIVLVIVMAYFSKRDVGQEDSRTTSTTQSVTKTDTNK